MTRHRRPAKKPHPKHHSHGSSRPVGVEKVGIVHLHERGFGFLVPLDGSPDAFMPPREVRDVMHGDTIKARVAPDPRKEGKLSATFLSIIKRGRQTLVGVLSKEHGHLILRPSDPRFEDPVRLLPGRVQGQPGQAAVVRITTWPAPGRSLQGQVLEVLGDPKNPGTDMLMVVRKHDWPDRFSPLTVAEASRYPTDPGPNDFRGRRDLRNLPVLTIDGEDAKDFDDALSIEKTRKGWRLGVHIADVSYYVREGGPIDLEARERATSLYLPDRCLPMLPSSLADGLCSLKERVPRVVVSVFMDFPFGSGLPVDVAFDLSVIQSRRRGVYEEVQQVLDGTALKTVQEKYSPVLGVLKDLQGLSRLVRAERVKRGAVDFDFPEVKTVLDREGRVIDVRKKPRLESHRIVEDFMIAANEAVASHLAARKAPALYRVHEPPSARDQEELVSVLRAYRVPFKVQDLVRPDGLQALLDSIRGGPLEPLISHMALRSLRMAVYSTRNLGHFGLASASYCHFTSPIRRYPDLEVHRALKSSLGWTTSRPPAGPKLDQLATHCSDRERLADAAEREADRIKEVQFMQDKLGREFPGVVSGLVNRGAFVEILPFGLEGFIPLERFHGDRYAYDETSRILKGQHRRVRLGDRLKVRVDAVDPVAQRITLRSLDA